MKKTTIPSKFAITLLALLFSVASYCQLPSFTITATSNPAACGGTGSITLTPAGTDPLATVTYAVYLLPNTTTPIVISPTPTISSLAAGNYRVVATQTLGALSNTSPPVNITIQSGTAPLVFTTAQTQTVCINDGKITTTIVTGNGPFTYTLYAGSLTTGTPLRGPQPSNIFNNIGVGTYTVMVRDICGVEFPQAIQVTQSVNTFSISSGSVIEGQFPSCTTAGITHSFTGVAGGTIAYPLTFRYTVMPPGGGTPIVVTQVVATGALLNNTIESVIPFYYDQRYTYNVQVTDACGRIYVRNNNVVNTKLLVNGEAGYANCDDSFLNFSIDKYVLPLTISFPRAPSTFNPTAANAAHPSPAVVGHKFSYGGPGNTIPEGPYVIQITDACGRIFTTEEIIVEYPEVGIAKDANAECGATTGFMSAKISIPGRTITQVTITGAPPAYIQSLPAGQVLPQNVSSYINPNPTVGFLMANIPLGTYVLTIVDSCGDIYTNEEIIVRPSGQTIPLDPLQRAGCDVGFGSVRLGTNAPTAPQLVSVTITDAPLAYRNLHPLPSVVSSNISGTYFFMNGLPEGDYVFDVAAACSTARAEITIRGHRVTRNDVDIVANCGSYDVSLYYASTGNAIESFWLQKYNTVTGTWGHPLTGVAYPEGSLPTAINSDLLTNNMLNINRPYEGDFRIIRIYYTYGNGTSLNNRCSEIIKTFTFGSRPDVTAVTSFPCLDSSSEIVIEATGAAPLTYKIVSKNGAPFLVDNGTSNVFTGLVQANYVVEVTDTCGATFPYPFTVNTLTPVEILKTGFCEGELSELYVQDYSFLTYEWWKEGAPETILSTTSSLEFPAFDSDTQSGKYFLKIISPDPDSCMNQQLFVIVDPNVLPNAGDDKDLVLCNEGAVLDLNAYLSTPHDTTGTWEDADTTGLLSGNLLSTATLPEGTYEFKYNVTGDCGFIDTAVIKIEIKDTPVAPVATPVAAVCEGEPVRLLIATVPNADSYQWTGPNNFVSTDQNPELLNTLPANSGDYSVTVTVNGCTSPPAVVNVLVKPNPAFVIEGNTSLCTGQSSLLSLTQTNFGLQDPIITYQWYFNGTLLATETDWDITVSEVGDYKVVVNNNGCESEKAVSVIENTSSFPIELEAGCKDFEYIVSITNLEEIPGITFAWTGPGGYTNTGAEINITDMATGEYIVTGTNADGCTSVEAITINNTKCLIPKGISPNGDTLNDNFDLSNLDIRDIHIYNRYGLKVYEKANYKNEWYGQSEKGDVPTGTYFYTITLSAGRQVSGWVYVQREVN